MGYFLPTDRPGMANPAEVFVRLCKLPEHAHITEAEARIEFLMRGHEEKKGGRVVLGTVFRPQVDGRLREVFTWLLQDKFGADDDEPIAFLVVLDAEFWLDSDDVQREILMYHELCHIQPAYDKNGAQRFDRETGLPVLTLAGHDVEEFAAVVERYGTYNAELREFVAAAQRGDGVRS